MNKAGYVFPAQDYDAISIRAAKCQVDIQGIDEDQIKLEGNFDDRDTRLGLDAEKPWLKVHKSSRGGNLKFTLMVSKHKPWVINIFAGQGDIRVRGIQSRLNIMTGHGSVSVEDCQGLLAVSSDSADISLKRFSRAVMPAEPPRDPQPPLPPTPPFARAPHPKIAVGLRWDWRNWEDFDWDEWGLNLGERIAGWALNMGRIFERTTIKPEDADISIAVSRGDFDCEDITSQAFLAKIGSGDLSLKRGRIGKMETIITRGDVALVSVLPENDWDIRTVHGDVSLSLPANAGARLDAATRHGDISSQIPMIRVSRQGPESYHGRRMVGVIGSRAEKEALELHISVMNGDIGLKSMPAVYPPSENVVDAFASLQYRSQLEVLQDLSQGRISVDEAERQIRNLQSPGRETT